MKKKQTYQFIGLILAVLVLPIMSNFVNAADFKSDKALRPPAVPLVACDPYFSIWSYNDELNGGITRHWTDHEFPLNSMVNIDGKAYRIMGVEPVTTPALEQKSVKVLPTKTIYNFAGAGVNVELEFLQPALPDDIDLMSRPVTYVTWNVTSTDGKNHNVSVYFDAGMELVVNHRSQSVVWSSENIKGMKTLKAGSNDQNILRTKGDSVRIDWGHFYLSASKSFKPSTVIANGDVSRKSFVANGKLTRKADKKQPRRVDEGSPVLAMQFGLKVKSGKTATCQAILAYDDIESILYFGDNLLPYWKRDGKDIKDIIIDASNSYDSIAKRCEEFDVELLEDLYNAGGVDYQLLGSLAYRQALGANKIAADKKGMPLMFSKECNSNGCMGTVDVFYPFAPQVILLNPTLAKASFVPILEYARSDRWRFPFAPHDIGTYPSAMGQVYGGGERSERDQMPVEESGNMMILVASVVQAENDIQFAKDYWDVLTVWANYLKSKGLDPENQLCTDDFAGHLAHNVNLSVKAIVGLAAYAKMADMMGEKETAASFRNTAEQYVKQWMEMADDGDHYRLAFDKPGTWSQKYNLIWDRLLDLNLFPESVAKKEMAYYKKMQNTYGLPLDNRSQYTKLDWIVWTASITGEKSDFQTLIAPIIEFLNATQQRLPMTDWYWTHNANHRGFKARPVVGGVFIRLMDDAKVWSKWVKNSDSVSGTWAKLPVPPKIVEIVPSSDPVAQTWNYTFNAPDADWYEKDFDAVAAGWKKGKGGFGSKGTPGATVRTDWNSSDIWIQREFEINEVPDDLKLYIHHDEDAKVYINGILAAELGGFTGYLEPVKISEKALKSMKSGKNVIAIHCHQTSGGQYVDAGFVRVIPQD